MIVVLYSTDFRPLNVVALDESAVKLLNETGCAIVFVPDKSPYRALSMSARDIIAVMTMPERRRVRIVATPIAFPDGERCFYTTVDEVAAVNLPCAFLPGQRSEAMLAHLRANTDWQ